MKLPGYGRIGLPTPVATALAALALTANCLTALTGDARRARPVVSNQAPMRDTLPLLEKIPFPAIRRGRLETLQVNVGYRCNQSCFHCHVNAGPNRTEEMTARRSPIWCSTFLERRRIATLDITGGAPELNRAFPPPGDAARDARRQGDGSLQPHDPGAAGPGRPRRVSRRASASRWWPRCRAISKTMSSASAAKACSTARSAACAAQRARLRPRSGLVAQSGLQSARPVAAAGASRARSRLQARARRALRHRVQQAVRARQHADPALRLDAGRAKASSTAIWICCRTRISTPISTA